MIRQGLPLGAWPNPDRHAWAGAIAEGDIFDGRGAAGHWAETTRNAVIAAYGRWLGFLAGCEPPALAEEPVQRVTGSRLARYLDHLTQTTGTVGQWAYFAHLRDAVRVMFPGNVPQILSRQVARLEHECQPRSKAPRIVATPRLIELGEKLMSDAVTVRDKVADLVAYRDGLMIALLAARPIRRRAFSIIRIGVHLRQVGEEWRLVFDWSEMKSGRAVETTVPERIVPFLERYLREIRPRFSGATEHSGLWAGTKGGPLTDKAIYRVIAERTREAFGQPVNPHLFRHCAATTVAILQPGRIGIAKTFSTMLHSRQRTRTTIRLARSKQAGSTRTSSPASTREREQSEQATERSHFGYRRPPCAFAVEPDHGISKSFGNFASSKSIHGLRAG